MILVVLCVLACWVELASSEPRVLGHGGRAARIRDDIPPDVPLVILSQEGIHFDVDGPPGAYDADASVHVSVRCNSGNWALLCCAGPLVSEGGSIPPERILLDQVCVGQIADQSAGQEYQSMEQPRVVAQGGFTGPGPIEVAEVGFRLMTTWDDTPGTYAGSIIFTHLVNP